MRLCVREIEKLICKGRDIYVLECELPEKTEVKMNREMTISRYVLGFEDGRKLVTNAMSEVHAKTTFVEVNNEKTR